MLSSLRIKVAINTSSDKEQIPNKRYGYYENVTQESNRTLPNRVKPPNWEIQLKLAISTPKIFIELSQNRQTIDSKK